MSGIIGFGGGDTVSARLLSQRWTGPRCFGAATTAIAANTLYAAPFVSNETFSCDQVSIRIGAGAAGSAKIGIYTADDLTNLPDALVAEINADLDTASIATLTAGFDRKPTISGGRLYWLATCFSGTPSPICWNHAVAQNGGFPWYVGSSVPSAWFGNGNAPSRVTRDAALTFVASTKFFPAVFGAATEGGSSPGAPIVALRKA